jgi:hypothetical protein
VPRGLALALDASSEYRYAAEFMQFTTAGHWAAFGAGIRRRHHDRRLGRHLV